jgi:hypothetical protein
MNANDDLRRHEPVQAALGAAGPGRSTAGIRALMHGRRLKGPAGACSSLFRSLEVSGEDQGPSRCRRHVAARAAWHGAGAGRRLAGLGAGGWPAHRCGSRWSGPGEPSAGCQPGRTPGGPASRLRGLLGHPGGGGTRPSHQHAPHPCLQTVVVDCRGHMLGRLASTLAKQLLSGQHVVSGAAGCWRDAAMGGGQRAGARGI